MPTLDMSRLTEGVVLPPELSGEIQTAAAAENPYFQLATKVAMPGTGVSFQSILSEPEAGWVGESEKKPVSKGTFGSSSVKPFKVAVIVPFTDEFKRDASKLYSAFESRIPQALTRKIVRTISGIDAAPGAEFTQLSKATAAPIRTAQPNAIYDDLLKVERGIVDAGGVLTGYALSPTGRFELLSAKDQDGRPLLLNDIVSGSQVARVLGAPITYSRDVQGPAANVLGYAADWSKFSWGTVEGVKVSATDQATLNIDGEMVSLWQHNMFAVRVETEVAFWGDLKFARKVTADASAPAGG